MASGPQEGDGGRGSKWVVQCSTTVPSATRGWREGAGPLSCTPLREGRMSSQKGRLPSRNHKFVVRGLLGTDLQTPPSNPPRPGLLRGRFGIDLTSIRHWFDIDFLIWPYFDVESMSSRCQIDPWGKREADSRVVSNLPVPNKPLTTLLAFGDLARLLAP